MEFITKNLPALALRGLTVFPRMNTSFDVERAISVCALERAMETGQEIFLVTQREIGVDLPEEKDLYEIGTISRVTQILRVSERAIRVMMEGVSRARLKRIWQREPFLQAQVEVIDEPKPVRRGNRTEALLRQTYANFAEYAELTQKLPDEVYAVIMEADDPGYLADFIAQQINLRYQDKQAILDELRRTQPQATVLVYAIFPRGLGVKDPCMVRNEKVNEGLEKLCDGRQCIFRNINDVFLWPDGSVNEKLLGDRLHPSREGYEVWLGDVLPQLRRIIK